MNSQIKTALRTVFAGLCLLLTPCFNVIDLAPDLIGCILIRSGLSRIFLMDRSLSEARTAARRLMTEQIFKLASPLLFILSPNDPTLVTLVTFTFGVLDLFFGIPLINSLFDGLDSVTVACDGGKSAENSEEIRLILKIFLWVRCVGAFIPECFCLFDPQYTGELYVGYLQTSALMRGLKPVTEAVQLVGISVFAAVVGVRLRRMFSGLWSDPAFIADAEKKRSLKYPDEDAFARRFYLNRSLTLIFAASVFVFRIYLSYFGILPEPLLFVFLMVASRTLARGGITGYDAKKLAAPAVVSGLAWLTRCRGSVIWFGYFGEEWQKSFVQYPLGVLDSVCLFAGCLWIIKMLDDCTLAVYGRRRIKTGIMKFLALMIAVTAFAQYSLPSLWDLYRLLSGGGWAVKRGFDTANVVIGVASGIFCAIFVFRVWLATGAMKEETDFD